jgi:hypothetical protein
LTGKIKFRPGLIHSQYQFSINNCAYRWKNLRSTLRFKLTKCGHPTPELALFEPAGSVERAAGGNEIGSLIIWIDYVPLVEHIVQSLCAAFEHYFEHELVWE